MPGGDTQSPCLTVCDCRFTESKRAGLRSVVGTGPFATRPGPFPSGRLAGATQTGNQAKATGTLALGIYSKAYPHPCRWHGDRTNVRLSDRGATVSRIRQCIRAHQEHARACTTWERLAPWPPMGKDPQGPDWRATCAWRTAQPRLGMASHNVWLMTDVMPDLLSGAETPRVPTGTPYRNGPATQPEGGADALKRRRENDRAPSELSNATG